MGFDYISLAPDKFVLPNGWRVCKVQDVAVVNEQSIQRGYKYEWIEYIDIASVEKGTVKSMETIPIKKAPSRARRIVRDKDTLIATVRPNLEHYVFLKVAKPNTIASTGFAVVTAKKVEPRYLYYYLTSPPFTEYLTRIADSHTSTYPAFNPEVIENAELLLPPEAYQRAIAHILGTLDDKIELNRKMNETLEAIARAIFKSWFIDFDPVRAKAEGRDPGLPKEIADLFPDSFEDSELGEIPKGWRVGTLKDVVIIHDSKRIPLSNRERLERQGPYPYYGAASVMDYIDDYIFDGVYVLIGEDGSVVNDDDTPVVQYIWGKLWVNNHAHVLTGKNGISTEHLLLFLKQVNIRPFITGAVQPKLNQGNLCRVPFLLPSEPVSQSFTEIIEPIFARIRANMAESRTLAAIRDALLPKLISGEIRVKDAERFLKEVAL